MRVTYIELLGQKHPLCFSLSASEELDEYFGSLENMDAELRSGKLSRIARAVDKILSVLMKYGRIYAVESGMEVPEELKCRPADVIDVTDEEAVKTIFAAVRSDMSREVEVETKNAGATQGA